MVNKIKVKFVLELRAAYMSRNSTAKTRHMFKNSVTDAFHITNRLGITLSSLPKL